MIYFGFAVADSMFEADCLIRHTILTLDEVLHRVGLGVVSCINPNHESTIKAMHSLGIHVPTTESAQSILLQPGDQLIVMGIRGPKRGLAKEYSDEVIAEARFVFKLYEVLGASA